MPPFGIWGQGSPRRKLDIVSTRSIRSGISPRITRNDKSPPPGEGRIKDLSNASRWENGNKKSTNENMKRGALWEFTRIMGSECQYCRV